MDTAPALDRFVESQDSVWPDVVAELRAGRKASHWMWFVFPQLAALGRSQTARHYGLSGLAEAQAYAHHPVLGPRLVECCRLLLALPDSDPVAVFGPVDTLKLRSCLTLFAAAVPGEPVYAQCLGRYYGGEPDGLTLQLLRT